MLYLSIDQHRKQLTVNLRDEVVGDVILKRQVSYVNWNDAVREFLRRSCGIGAHRKEGL